MWVSFWTFVVDFFLRPGDEDRGNAPRNSEWETSCVARGCWCVWEENFSVGFGIVGIPCRHVHPICAIWTNANVTDEKPDLADHRGPRIIADGEV
jgi:hypothetical protein